MNIKSNLCIVSHDEGYLVRSEDGKEEVALFRAKKDAEIFVSAMLNLNSKNLQNLSYNSFNNLYNLQQGGGYYDQISGSPILCSQQLQQSQQQQYPFCNNQVNPSSVSPQIFFVQQPSIPIQMIPSFSACSRSQMLSPHTNMSYLHATNYCGDKHDCGRPKSYNCRHYNDSDINRSSNNIYRNNCSNYFDCNKNSCDYFYDFSPNYCDYCLDKNINIGNYQNFDFKYADELKLNNCNFNYGDDLINSNDSLYNNKNLSTIENYDYLDKYNNISNNDSSLITGSFSDDVVELKKEKDEFQEKEINVNSLSNNDIRNQKSESVNNKFGDEFVVNKCEVNGNCDAFKYIYEKVNSENMILNNDNSINANNNVEITRTEYDCNVPLIESLVKNNNNEKILTKKELRRLKKEESKRDKLLRRNKYI